MKQRKSIALALAIGFQFVVIFSIVIFKVAVLAGGTNVMLKIAPVDPRDWLRGDYAVFRYDISDIPSKVVEDKKPQQEKKPAVKPKRRNY